MRRRVPQSVAAFLVALCTAGAGTRDARAQELQPRILLVVGPGVPRAMRHDLEAVFGDIGTVMSDGDYQRAAGAAGLDPTGPDAAAAFMPAQGVDLGIVVARDGLSLRVSHYAGASGTLVLQDSVRLEDNQLDPTDHFFLRARARRALEAIQSFTASPPQTWPPVEGAPLQGGYPAQPPSGYPQGAPAPGFATPSEAPEMQGASEAGGAGADRTAAGRGLQPLRVRLSVGLGLTTHATDMPTDSGIQRVDEAVVPGLDFLLEGEGGRGAFKPGVRIDYMTSIGYQQTETPPGGVPRSSAARKHEVLLDLTGRIGGGEHDGAVSFPIALGFALRDLRAEVEMSIPRYTLAGPHLRALVRIPIAGGDFVLEAGPDLQWLMFVSKALRRAGIADSGTAIGVEASLWVPLGERWSGRILYRESHASLDTVFSASFADVQRFVTLGVAASY